MFLSARYVDCLSDLMSCKPKKRYNPSPSSPHQNFPFQVLLTYLDLSEQEKCTPEDEPKPMKKKVSGASRRSRAGDVKQALPPCATSLVCKAVEPKKYACLAENRACKI